MYFDQQYFEREKISPKWKGFSKINGESGYVYVCVSHMHIVCENAYLLMRSI